MYRIILIAHCIQFGYKTGKEAVANWQLKKATCSGLFSSSIINITSQNKNATFCKTHIMISKTFF